MPKQESGIRPSCGLPYELYADAQLTDDKKNLEVMMKAGNEIFGERASGTPIKVYAPGEYLTLESEEKNNHDFETARAWDFAVSAGDKLTNSFPLSAFRGKEYYLRLYGPNGFFREFKGTKNDPSLQVLCDYQRNPQQKSELTGNIALHFINRSSYAQTVQITDNAYDNRSIRRKIQPNNQKTIVLNVKANHGWYNFTVNINNNNYFVRQYAGRVETGGESISDPAMGKDQI
jgi:phospholipase C